MNIALFQQNICWNDRQGNYDRVCERLSALANPVDVIVLPETFSCGFGDNMVEMAEPQEGPSMRFASEMAREYDALFVATWPVRVGEKVYNRLHWVRPDGTYGFYDKAHTFRVSGEADIIARGTERQVFEWRGWRIKPAVCYDLRFPKWLRNEVLDEPSNHSTIQSFTHSNTQTFKQSNIQSLSYDLMIVCANWPGSRHEAWTTLLKARAIENLSYVVGVNRVGTDGAGISYTGNSSAVDFKGLPIAECEPGKEQLLTARLDREALDIFRQHWPFYLDFD